MDDDFDLDDLLGDDTDSHHDDMLDDLLESPPASPVKSMAPAMEEENLEGSKSFLPNEIAEMENMLDNMLESSNSSNKEKPDSSDDDDSSGSGMLHGDLDDLDLGDFEQVEDADDDKHDSPVKPPDDDLDMLDDLLASPTTSPNKSATVNEAILPPEVLMPVPEPKNTTPSKAPVPKAKPSPARKPSVPKSFKPVSTYQEKPIGDIPKTKAKRKPLSFLSKKTTTNKEPASKPAGQKKKGPAKKFISSITSWAKPKSAPKPKKVFTSRVQTNIYSPSRNGMSSTRSACSIVSVDNPRSPTVICGTQFQPFMHSFRAPCELCVFYLSEEERLMLDATGRHLRVMQTAGGCCRGCQVFPRGESEAPVRLCRKCFFNSHRGVFQKFVLEQGILQA